MIFKLFGVIFFIIMFIPFFSALFFSFGTFDLPNSIYSFFTVQAYLGVFTEHRWEAISIIVSRSIWVASLSVFFAFVFTFLLIQNVSSKTVIIILTIISMPLLLNIGIRGIAWLDILKESEKFFHYTYPYNNNYAVVFSMISSSIAFPIFSIFISLKIIDKYIWYSALDLGASPLTRIIKIIIPNILPGLVVGWIGSFAISMVSSFEVHFLTDSKISLSQIYNDLFSVGKLTESLALSATIIFFYMFIIYIFYIWIKKYYQRLNNA